MNLASHKQAKLLGIEATEMHGSLRQDIVLGHRQRCAVSESVGLHIEHCKKNAPMSSKSIQEKQISSPCDSATMEPSPSLSQSHESGALIGKRIKLLSPIDKWWGLFCGF